MIKIFTLLILSINAFLFSQTPEDEIIVRLNTEHALLPIYCAKVATDHSSFPSSHAASIGEVLSFDLSHNGMTKAQPYSKARQSWVESFRKNTPESLDQWKSLGAFYVVDARIKEKDLHTLVISVNSGEQFQGPVIHLSGDLDKDRKEVHILSDAIHKTLFGKSGIATTRVLYTINTPKSTKERPLSDVWVSDYDGYNAVRVTNEDSLCVTPSFIPPDVGYRSGNFFYVSYRYGQPKIFMGSLNSPQNHRFTNIRGNQLMPQTSFARNQVTFICDAAGNPDVFLQNFHPKLGPQGKPRQIFAAPHATQASPVFSPDNSKIAFVSNKDGRPRIYVIDVPKENRVINAPDATLISRESRENTSPTWSPDGSMIAYSAKTDGVRQIWVYDFRLERERQLTQGPGNKENPTWAPNSLHIMFNSADQNLCEVYLINLHEPTATKISRGPGKKRFPSWEPIPNF